MLAAEEATPDSGATRPAWWRRAVSRERLPWLAGGGIAVLLALSWALFALDSLAHRGQVSRNVRIGDVEVSGMRGPELAQAMDRVDRDYASTRVSVRVQGDDAPRPFTVDAGTVGLHVDAERTAENAMAVGRTGSVPSRWWGWLRGFAADRRAALAVSVDREAVAEVAAEHGKEDDKAPEEARIALNRNGKLVGVAGKPGTGIDANRLARDLLTAANRGTPIRVTAHYGEVKPRFTKDDADEVAERAEELVAKPLPVAAEGATASISVGTLRTLMSARPGPTRLELEVDEAKAAEAAEKALARAGNRPTEPVFNVNASGGVDITPGAPGRVCCSEGAGRKVVEAILDRPDEPVELGLREALPKLSYEEAQALGVKERVADYTTRHACCQNRVKNIHRIADIVRGQVIPPGQSFSINDFVGRRTVEKGFVVDKVIEDGKYAEDVGGGISQFATTLFNAAWFAGLEFGTYQSHSLYISRYPYGREATLGFPHPDLVIKNPTPYGVMIWPTYTGTSITIGLYSTKWVASVKQTGQDKVPSGSCTKVITKRQRTFLDGRVVNDTTTALYRANEGQNCGDEEPPSPSTTTRASATTTRPPATTTTRPPASSTTTAASG